jgi:predicted transcriptional regulator
MSLLQLTNQAAEELNVSNLTNTDKNVLLHIWNSTHEGQEVFISNYEELPIKLKDISKSQFYKSIKKLLDEGIIEKVGSDRSGTYQMIIPG